MNRTKLLATTGVVVALTITGAAGCSALGGAKASGSRTPTAHSSSNGAAVYRQAAACIRAHGVPNFPDPVQDPQSGEWALPHTAQKPPRSALNACRSILNQVPDKKTPEDKPLTAAEMVKAKQWATCMRRHGLADFPSDPDANGTFTLPQRYERLGKTGMRQQLEACHKVGVNGIHMTVPSQDNGNG
jgi:hypothetical protein